MGKIAQKLHRIKGAKRYVLCTLFLTILFFIDPLQIFSGTFRSFQRDSDSLIWGRIYASTDHIPTTQYGLGRIHTLVGISGAEGDFDQHILNDENEGVVSGYSLNFPGIVVDDNEYTAKFLVEGNRLRFPGGQEYEIVKVYENDLGSCIEVDSPSLLSYEENGALSDVAVVLADGTLAPASIYASYESSYGLQGHILGRIGALLGTPAAKLLLPFLCTLLFSSLVVLTAVLLRKKYGRILAGSFLAVFALSAWVSAFASSVYWVEATWLLPLVFGLIFSIYQKKLWVRSLCYIGVFLSILIKSLCGYEYISFVMVGAIFAVLADWLVALLKKEYKRSFTLLKYLVCLGLFALAGFVLALAIHGQLRGQGDIISGLKIIYEEDVLRRTLGGDPASFDAELTASLNASVPYVINLYFCWGTPIVGIVSSCANVLIFILPVILFISDAKKKLPVNKRDLCMYIIATFSSLSWIVLAKSHSYVHTHLNFVAWYYFSVPISLYIIAKWICGYLMDEKYPFIPSSGPVLSRSRTKYIKNFVNNFLFFLSALALLCLHLHDTDKRDLFWLLIGAVVCVAAAFILRVDKIELKKRTTKLSLLIAVIVSVSAGDAFCTLLLKALGEGKITAAMPSLAGYDGILRVIILGAGCIGALCSIPFCNLTFAYATSNDTMEKLKAFVSMLKKNTTSSEGNE